MDIGTIKKVIKNLLNSEHIIAIYLFGSFAKGTEKVRSDIDLGFVFDERFYKGDPFRALQEAELLSVEISKKMRKTVDVVVLNGASLSFVYHTLRESICLYEKDTVTRILYEINVDNKYQDFVPFIKELREIKRRDLIGRD